MRTYLVLAGGHDVRAFSQSLHHRVLVSFAFPKTYRKLMRSRIGIEYPVSLIVDSGAFSIFNNKRINHKIGVDDYLAWMREVRPELEARFVDVRFINFDVIGDHEASHRNFRMLCDAGQPVAPVVHYGSTDEQIEEVMSAAPFVAIGGLVPLSGRKSLIRPFLDRCVRIARPYRTEMHLLGVMRPWVFEEYPQLFSCDSSTWSRPLRFGLDRYPDLCTDLEDRERAIAIAGMLATRVLLLDTPDPVWDVDVDLVS
ncbi:hypothetical protein IHN63_00690 [Deinococcus sp. 6YEL10]|uniref:hypothetical protein n=1 Tax=Deinococcus sp. 6YEL10 TaxID=2745870 RepID=UPI001E303787|nr:hypothetical protein [Deinococcus sp. 6YEL10]MCD0159815.1 hypothetical protein [Deinococcus sp. 6YEL10]